MLYRFYIYDELVLIPVVAETEEGFYVDTLPVQRFHAKQVEEWKSAMTLALMVGNRIIPTPEPSESGGSVVLKSLRIEKWIKFEKRACMYTVHHGSSYIKLYRTGKAPDGMWGPINQVERTFSPRAPWQIIVDAIADDVIKQPEAHPIKVSGL